MNIVLLSFKVLKCNQSELCKSPAFIFVLQLSLIRLFVSIISYNCKLPGIQAKLVLRDGPHCFWSITCLDINDFLISKICPFDFSNDFLF